MKNTSENGQRTPPLEEEPLHSNFPTQFPIFELWFPNLRLAHGIKTIQ
jgi:hypothetical protein